MRLEEHDDVYLTPIKWHRTQQMPLDIVQYNSMCSTENLHRLIVSQHSKDIWYSCLVQKKNTSFHIRI